MKTSAVRSGVIWIVLLSIALAGCNTPTPTAEPTATAIPPTAVPTAVPPTATFTATPVPPTKTPTNTPTVTSTPLPTATPTRTPIPLPTRTKAPTATTAPKTPPLAAAIQQTAEYAVEIKKAIFSGGESCDDLFRQFNGILNAPTYNVAGQSSQIQTAYALYRQAVDYVAVSKAAVVDGVCKAGGGNVGKLDVYFLLKQMDQTLSYLDQATGLLK
jgi:hypothetical protein